MPNTSCPQQWQLRSLRRERVVSAGTTECRPWCVALQTDRSRLFCAQLIGFPAGMETLSILAVEAGQLKVQLYFSVQQLPEYCSAPVRPNAMLASLPQLLFGCNA